MRSSLSCLGAALALATAAPAHAAWHKASSRHFVIYADTNPKQVQEFASRLERFDQAVRFALKLKDPAMGDGNRVTVFVLPDEVAVQKLVGNKSLSGYYTARATGPIALVPLRSYGQSDQAVRDLIFFHEYAHHLTMSDLARPYPEWLAEGLAEFLATAVLERNGGVTLGGGANHRAGDLHHANTLPLATLLAGNLEGITNEQRQSTVYARGWLLTHYLIFEQARVGQLNRYLAALADGVPALNAATAAFGDLRKLDSDLQAYLRRIQRSITVMKVPADKAQAGPITVQQLSSGGQAVMPLRIRLKNCRDQSKPTDGLVAEVRAVQARFRGDPLVEATLAEAELESGNADAALAAAQRALQSDPRNVEALIYKGRALMEGDTSSDDAQRHARFEAARQSLIAANKVDTEDPEPLYEFYRSYLVEGVRPNANAIEAMHYASNLAPQDLALRMNSAMAYLNLGKLKEARQTLAPVAYSPHARSLAEVARRMIARIDAGDARGALRAASRGESPPTTPAPKP